MTNDGRFIQLQLAAAPATRRSVGTDARDSRFPGRERHGRRHAAQRNRSHVLGSAARRPVRGDHRPPSVCAIEPLGTACDDGNQCTTGDACIGAACAAVDVPDRTACADGDGCTFERCIGGNCQTTPIVCDTCEVCDPTLGFCVGAPQSSCRTASQTLLTLQQFPFDNAVRWTWSRGQSIDRTELGDPLEQTDYTLCIFDESAAPPSLFLRSRAPAGSDRRGLS